MNNAQRKPKVAIIFFSTSRYEFLFPMLESLERYVDFSGVDVHKIFIDDYPKTRDLELLEYIREKYAIDNMILNETNLSQSVSWRKAWDALPSDIEYIWQQEDDLEILEPVDVAHMIRILEASPVPLYQICLKRNVCYSGDNDFVYKIESQGDGEEIVVDGQPLVKFRGPWFIAHPGIYPRWVANLDYPYNPQEGVLPPRILRHNPAAWAALWGRRGDRNRIYHLGEYSHGSRCIEGEPGYERTGQYAKDKDYYSLRWLTEWKGSRNYKMSQLHLKYTGNTTKADEYKTKCLEEDADNELKYKVALERRDWKRASIICPGRVEAWYHLMMENSDQKFLAYAYGKQGYLALIGPDTRSGIAKEYWDADLYNYRFIFEYAMVCFYSGNLDGIEGIAALVVPDKCPAKIYERHQRNKQFYKNPITQGGWSPYKAPSAVIIDNFLEDPMAERAFALAQEYSVKGNYPGSRTKGFATDDDRKMFERILGKRITYWPTGEGSYNGSYQCCTADMRSWIHRDRTSFSAILFLTPDPPPNSGTKTYVHKATGKTLEKDNMGGILDADSNNYDAWHVADVVENRFNRLSIFQGVQSHMSAGYFGSRLADGRLFKTFFFNAEDALA